MKRNFVLRAFFSALLFASTNAVQAQNSWAMATVDDGNSIPSFSFAEYNCLSETGVNGTEYLRIYKVKTRLDLIKSQYGYRLADKQIFVYDFETNEERQAFDFTLSAGEHFSTYNGMEWEVDEAVDTLVNTSYLGKGEGCTKRLLKVHSADGRWHDQWLEDFGSFANHFMILPMSEEGKTHTLWMEYAKGCYLARDISADPFFTHVSDKPEEPTGFSTLEEFEEYLSQVPYINCTYQDGTFTVEDGRFRSNNREYNCYYRVGDDLYWTYEWYLHPATMTQEVRWLEDSACYTGLPDPQSGKYTIHFNREDKPSSIAAPAGDASNSPTESFTYDLQGHRLNVQPNKGVYIRDGKKYVR